MKIKDAVVLVTGANRGLGRELVIASLERGAARVYATAREPKQLEELVRANPERVIALALDITDRASLTRAAARAPDVTLLLNNAGVLASYRVLESTDEQLARDFGTNLFGTLGAVKAFLPALERSAARGSAALVNVLSVVSLASMPGLGGYSASKAAAYSITQALRADLAEKGIAVHAALPGTIDTDMVRSFAPPKTSAATVAQGILAGVEQGAEEIAPDPMSRELVAQWQRDPAALGRKLANMSAA